MDDRLRTSREIEDFLLAVQGTDTIPIMVRAEEAMQGMLVLNGTGPEPVFVGIPPRWEENPCGVGGYTWTMSRLRYMVTLCKAFLITGHRRYLDKVETDLNAWFDNVPAPAVPHDYESACYYHGIHNWRMLEVGYRMIYTFPILLAVLRRHGRDKALVDRICHSIAQHAERIAAGSHLLWPGCDHNHYTQEINGLLSAASMIPDDPRAAEWIEQAVDGLERACASQLTADGSQSEGAAEYHTAVVIDFCYSIFFLQRCGRSFSPEFVQRVRNGLAFSVQTVAPDGSMLAFGDTDPLLYTPCEAAILAFLLLGQPCYLTTLRRLTGTDRIRRQLVERYPWGMPGMPVLLRWLNAPCPSDTTLLPTVTWQRQMDQYIVRSGWQPTDSCLFFSCHSPVHQGSNHAHMDQLGVVFSAMGKVLLQDPGRYTYKDCEDRHLYKSSQVHSVPTVDGRDAFAYLGTFAYGPQKEGAITAAMDTPLLQGAIGFHTNYEPVVIERSAALVDGVLLLIADTFRGAKGRRLKTFFHLNSTTATIEGTSFVTGDAGPNLRICTSLAPEQVSLAVLEGRLSNVFYHDYPSNRAVYTYTPAEDKHTVIYVAAPFADPEQDTLSDVTFADDVICFVYQGQLYRIELQNGHFVPKEDVKERR